MKKLMILFSFFGGLLCAAEDVSKVPLLRLDNYRPNPCVVDYAPKYYTPAYEILAENKLQHDLGVPELDTLLFKDGPIIKGVCIFGTDDGYVYRLSVGKSYQGQGIGKALLHEAMHRLYTDYEIKKMSLHYETPKAREYYRHLGWQVCEKSSKCKLRIAK